MRRKTRTTIDSNNRVSRVHTTSRKAHERHMKDNNNNHHMQTDHQKHGSHIRGSMSGDS